MVIFKKRKYKVHPVFYEKKGMSPYILWTLFQVIDKPSLIQLFFPFEYFCKKLSQVSNSFPTFINM